METKFTKGQWRIHHTDGDIYPKSSKIEISSEFGGWVCLVQNNGIIGKEEGDANAKLIAAAPELLTACNLLKNKLDELVNKYNDRSCELDVCSEIRYYYSIINKIK